MFHLQIGVFCPAEPGVKAGDIFEEVVNLSSEEPVPCCQI